MAFFLHQMKQQNQLDSVSITICNVGSRKVTNQDDYGSQEWGIFAPNLTIYGFDADAEACEIANANIQARQVNWQEKHFPLVLSNKVGEATIYVTKAPMCSSLYPPNESYLKRFPRLPELASLDFTFEVETTTLDIVSQTQNMNKIDFLQVDVQGADLLVLEGAKELLSQSILAIQVEVEFSPLYVNQPLFPEIDTFLREQGFALFDLHSPSRETRSPLYSTLHPGQLLWADALYLRDPFHEKAPAFLKQPEQLLKLACIADILEFTDYALELLEYLTLTWCNDPRYNLADSIVKSIAQVPETVAAGLASFPTVQRLNHLLTQPISEFELIKSIE